MALRRAAGDRETFKKLEALVFLLLWAEIAAAAGRNPAREPWMRLRAPRPGARTLRRARSSISGRRARG
jgi:hypothetical protein